MRQRVKEYQKELTDSSLSHQKNKNLFYSCDNLTKLCAEGAIVNLMNMLGFSSDMLSFFWQLSKTDVSVLKNHFQ